MYSRFGNLTTTKNTKEVSESAINTKISETTFISLTSISPFLLANKLSQEKSHYSYFFFSFSEQQNINQRNFLEHDCSFSHCIEQTCLTSCLQLQTTNVFLNLLSSNKLFLQPHTTVAALPHGPPASRFWICNRQYV